MMLTNENNFLAIQLLLFISNAIVFYLNLKIYVQNKNLTTLNKIKINNSVKHEVKQNIEDQKLAMDGQTDDIKTEN